jgi:hypothetical protein
VLGPYQRAEDLTRYEEGLRKAGLPEMISQPACPRGDKNFRSMAHSVSYCGARPYPELGIDRK